MCSLNSRTIFAISLPFPTFNAIIFPKANALLNPFVLSEKNHTTAIIRATIIFSLTIPAPSLTISFTIYTRPRIIIRVPRCPRGDWQMRVAAVYLYISTSPVPKFPTCESTKAAREKEICEGNIYIVAQRGAFAVYISIRMGIYEDIMIERYAMMATI